MDAALIRSLAQVVGEEHVLSSSGDVLVYECDAFTIGRQIPLAVVLPGSAEELVEVVRLLYRAKVPVVPRGAGTSLSGGCMPPEGAVVLPLTRLNRVLAIDYRNRLAVVEAGLVNARLTDRVKHRGWHFAPDPSSQTASTIGGNIAENAGGPHTLKYGVTVNHVLGMELVLPNGAVTWAGGMAEDAPGYDLTGLMVGSEGTMAIATKAIVRLTRLPQAIRTVLAVFDTILDATHTISDLIAAGIIPAALEMMDQPIIQAAEQAFNFGLPTDAGAVLIIEIDGPEAGLDDLAERIITLCRRHHVRFTQLAADPAVRADLWKVRKRSAGAVGRLSPSYVTQDGVVPRTKIPEMLQQIAQIGAKYNLRIANLMHAGDGNLHPIILFDERDPDQVQRVLKASYDILKACVDLGGTVTGEHGIGVEKIEFLGLLYSPADIRLMEDLRNVFNPDHLLNPGKMFPTEKSCAMEIVRPRPLRAAL